LRLDSETAAFCVDTPDGPLRTLFGSWAAASRAAEADRDNRMVAR
jgi:hypothetical protein